jgi:hypothetical protein
MTTQQLIYETAVPVRGERHKDWSVEVGAHYGFARTVNSVPLMAVEFPSAAPEYPIVFAGAEGSLMPAVILGYRGNENLFLEENGKWQAKYVPAFIRRYPFIFSNSADGKTFTLCIDEAFPGFNKEGRGQRLFGDDGKPSAYVDDVLKFLQEYQAQFRRTQLFCKKVQELQLLEPMQAQVSMGSGERLSLSGFQTVSRAKLKALAGDKLAELAQTDELELLYLHLQSKQNFNRVSERLATTQGMPESGEQISINGASARAPSGANGAERAAAD